MNTPTPDPRLQDLISQERALFRGEDDELDDEEFTDQQDTTFRLRTQIAAMPARSWENLARKAAYVQDLYAATGETLDDAIQSEGYSDLAFGLVVTRDLLKLLGM